MSFVDIFLKIVVVEIKYGWVVGLVKLIVVLKV